MDVPVKGSKKNSVKRTDARQDLVCAGLELFGEYGIKGTSTRMLAKAAGTNISAISYYFGSKDGLYLAVIEHIITSMAQYVMPYREAARKTLEQPNLARAEVKQGILALLHGFATMFVASPSFSLWAKVLLREQANPTPAFDVLYVRHISPLQQLILHLLAVYTGLSPDEPLLRLRTQAFITQVLGFFVAREAILRLLGAQSFGEEHVRMIYAILAAHAQASLDASITPEDGQ